MSKNFWKGLTIFALGLFLFSRVLNDVILLYISSRFIWLVNSGGIAMMAVGASYAALALHKRANKDHHHDHGHTDDFHHHHDDHEHTEDCNHDHEHSEDCDHEHEHDHEHGAPVTWWGLLIALMPLILGLMVPQQALGADALATRKLNLQTWHVGSVDVALRNNEKAGLIEGEKTIPEWLVEFANMPRSEWESLIDDEPVAVTGFVYTDERFAPNQFMVTRYIVTCCVADAQPLGLIVQTNGELPEFDSWVAVEGEFELIDFDGELSPAIVSSDLRPFEEPRQPYIYIDG
ncbi:MAG: TIGR03943 family protein [Chloroflexota bacterium]